MRQAWLIMAHNEFTVLQHLVSMLDDERSDFYLHFDAKVQSLPTIEIEKGRLFVVKDRVDVRWGTVSQLEAELLLLETAHQSGPYAHYHILSGVHLPLKPFDRLMQFYDEHSDEEIVRFWQEDEGDADFKLRRYHFPVQDFKSPVPWRRNLCQKAWTAVLKIQKVFGIRHLKDCSFRKTDQWLSVTEAACSFLISNKERILRKYKWAFCPDEYFIASELLSDGQFKLYDCQNLLYAEFDRESPKSFPMIQFDELQKTGYWWARKFTSKHAN